jgi:hypothetical protein
LDVDLQQEIQTVMSQQGWPDGVLSEVFVYTANNIQICQGPPIDGYGCTFYNPQAGYSLCAYHGSFVDSSNNPVVYAVMPAFFGPQGCLPLNLTVQTSPNGQESSDEEVAYTSHELFESITDPLPHYDTAWNTGQSNQEIADLCQDSYINYGNVYLNGGLPAPQQGGSTFFVAAIYDNYIQWCVLGVPSLQLSIFSGQKGVRGDSTVTVTAEVAYDPVPSTFTLKTQLDPAWSPNYPPPSTGHEQMFGFEGAWRPLIALDITLTSNPSNPVPDAWDLGGVWVSSTISKEIRYVPLVIGDLGGTRA